MHVSSAIYALIFRSSNTSVHTLSHGIQLLRQLDLEEPDIILLATRLSDISGAEVLQRLREFSAIPVMMLCDECDEDEHVRLLDLGADDLIAQTFQYQRVTCA